MKPDDHLSRPVQRHPGRIEAGLDERRHGQGQGRQNQPLVLERQRQAPIDAVVVGAEPDIAGPGRGFQDHADGQRNRVELDDRFSRQSRRGNGEPAEEPDGFRILCLILGAQEEGNKDIARSGDSPGENLVVLDPVSRAFAQDQVEKDCLRAAGLEIVDQGDVNLPGPRPGQALGFLVFIQAVLVNQDEDDVARGGGRTAEKARPQVPGFPLDGLNDAESLDGEGDEGRRGPDPKPPCDPSGHPSRQLGLKPLDGLGETLRSDRLGLGDLREGLDLRGDLGHPVLGRGMRLEPALGPAAGRAAGQGLQEPAEPVRVVSRFDGIFDGHAVRFVFVFPVVAPLDDAPHDVAEGVLKDPRELGQLLGAVAGGRFLPEDLEHVHQAGFFDRRQSVLAGNMADLVGDDGGHHLLVLAPLDDALRQEDEPAGSGHGVDLVRVQDEEVIAAVGFGPVRAVADGLAHDVQVIRETGVVIDFIAGKDQGGHGPADVVFLLVRDLREGRSQGGRRLLDGLGVPLADLARARQDIGPFLDDRTAGEKPPREGGREDEASDTARVHRPPPDSPSLPFFMNFSTSDGWMLILSILSTAAKLASACLDL